MALKMGIVGLPNVGKSTLFNAITNSNIEAANYPFATIKPNVGIVEVKDKRLEELSLEFNSKKVIPTTFEFIDIAGLIKGASLGEGLGNAFLANIREADAICQVVRCFEDKNITHVEGTVDPIRDIEIINLELIIADQESIKKKISKLGKRVEHIKDKDEKRAWMLLKKAESFLESGKLLNQMPLDDNEKIIIKGFQLLTTKSFLYVANISDEDLTEPVNKKFKLIEQYAKKQNIPLVKLAAEFESQISRMPKKDREMFMDEYNIKTSGLEKLIKASYELLELNTFFTAGPDEARAWTFKKGWLAPKCAGVIHTDFERGFIKAEIYSYSDFQKFHNEKAIKENGKMRLEGKTYLMQDGDVCFFKFNV